MSNIISSEDFGLKIYNRFPPRYREDDVGQNLALKRFIEALSDGGYKYIIEDANSITFLIDPSKVDEDILPILFKQYGLEIFNGIPEEYLRYLLPKLGEAWSKKGSLSVVEFITSSLTGIKTSTEITFDEMDCPLVKVKLEMDYNIGGYFPNSAQFEKLLTNFIPFYCDLSIVYSYMFYEKQSVALMEDFCETDISIADGDEPINISRYNHNISNMAIVGKAIAGKSVVGMYEDYSDLFEDTIKEVRTEEAVLTQPTNSFTNNVSCTLNRTFHTNRLYDYDIITVNGEKTVRY